MSTEEFETTTTTLTFDQIDQGLRRGRQLRSRAFASVLKALFSREKDDRQRDQGVRLPDCRAAA